MVVAVCALSLVALGIFRAKNIITLFGGYSDSGSESGRDSVVNI